MRGAARLLIVPAALTLLLCAGCIRLGVEVAVAPDQSTSARLLVGLDSSLGDMTGGENPFADLAQSPVGKRWTFRDFTDGSWKMSEAVGHAAPGEGLFPDEGDGPRLRVRTTARRLSTRYDITLIAPPPPSTLTQPPEAPADQPAAAEDQPGMEAMAGLAQSLMGGMEVRFSLRGPGRIVATTGREVAPGQAEWKLDLTQMSEQQTTPDFRLTTEIPNWVNLGRLADQIVMRGGPAEAGGNLASALDRGLLPNPPVTAPGDKLAAADYQRLLEIIARLDAAVAPEVTDMVLKQARLNDEQVSAAAIAAAHARLMKLDVTAVVQQATIKSLSAALGGP
jgi:hypothetical protein